MVYYRPGDIGVPSSSLPTITPTPDLLDDFTIENVYKDITWLESGRTAEPEGIIYNPVLCPIA